MRHENDVRDLVAAAIKHFGRLDVAVNNAGTEGEGGPLGQKTVDNYHATFDTNVLGTMLSLKHELPLMPARGGGIINISSIAGQVDFARVAIYVASEHAVEGLTKAAALEAAAAGCASTPARPARSPPRC